MPAELTHEQRIDLRKRICETFDLNGIRELCEAINIDFENLGGDTRDRKALELIGYCQRRGMFRQLIDACIALRPQVAWPLPGGGQSVPAKTPAASNPISSAKLTTILFMAATPLDQEQLRIGVEVNAVDAALREASHRDQFDLVQHHATRVTDIQKLLLRHKPDIVHFAGHGSATRGLIFEDIRWKVTAPRSR